MPLPHTRVVCQQSAGQVTMYTTFRIQEFLTTLEQQQALAIDVRDNLITKLKSACAGTWKLFNIIVYAPSDSNLPPYILPCNEVGSGTLIANQVCVQFNLYSGQAGKSGRGHFYIGGTHSGAWVDGLLSGTALAQLTANVATINAKWKAGGTGPWHLAIFSRKNNALYGMKELVLTRIPATLGSRRIGVGQ